MSVLRRLKNYVRDAIPDRWRVPVKYHYSKRTGTLEPEMALLPHLVRSGERCIDVGGNFGAYSYRLAAIGARLDVFEPNPICLRALNAWSAGKPAVTIHDCALSDSEGIAELAVPVSADGVEHDASGSLELRAGDTTVTRRVAMRTLDSFGLRDAALIKIDVEGHEAGVLAGGRQTILASLPAIIIEIEQRHSSRPIVETFAAIEALGYSGYFLKHGQLVELSHFDVSRDQSIEAFGNAGDAYFNNFLFLAQTRIAAGRYSQLFGR